MQSSGIHFQGDGVMISSYVLKAAEEKMDALFSAYTERNRQDFDESWKPFGHWDFTGCFSINGLLWGRQHEVYPRIFAPLVPMN